MQYPLYLLSQAIVHVLCYETNISIYLKFASFYALQCLSTEAPKVHIRSCFSHISDDKL